MEFLSGMIVGAGLLAFGAFAYKSYKDSKKKDDLLATTLGKEFKEGITLNEKGK